MSHNALVITICSVVLVVFAFVALKINWEAIMEWLHKSYCKEFNPKECEVCAEVFKEKTFYIDM